MGLVQNVIDPNDQMKLKVEARAFQLFWFGVFPSDWVDFLDGFVLQFIDERMVVHSKHGVKMTHPPFWWNF